MKCPNCKGNKKILLAFPPKHLINGIDCYFCNGTGIHDGEYDQSWKELGNKLKQKRINKRLTTSKVARLLKMNRMDLVNMERGLIKPIDIDFDKL